MNRLASSVGRGKRLIEHEVAARMRRCPIHKNTVLFESFAGNGMLCNPEALFRALLAAPDMAHLRFVWALARGADPAIRAAFAAEPRVDFVVRRSVAYYRELGRDHYLINNATFPHAFAKRPEQVYLSTWHGTPLKSMGYDLPGGALESANVLRNFLSADYLLAPNDQTVSMYLDAYRLRHVLPGQLLAVGTPRIDQQFVPEETRERTLNRLRSGGAFIDPGARVVLYAPTWRGVFDDPDNDLDRLCTDVTELRRRLCTGSTLLVKVHQRVYREARTDARLAGVLVPNDIPTNDVLAATDVLVSDYSSITVDFLASRRPIVRYVPDLEDYTSTRGLTVDLAALPGPVCRTIDELAAVLECDLSGQASTPAYSRARETYCPRETGHAARDVIDAVFRDEDRPPVAGPRRPSLLIYLGGMRTNGITTAALSLLGKLDYDRVDVTVTFPAPNSAETSRHAAEIDARARVLPRLGRTTWTQVRATPFPVVGGRLPFIEDELLHEQRLHDEWRRCFGDSRFDHVVNFGGYSAFFAKLLRCAPTGMNAIWLHNDMRAEMSNPGRSSWLRANIRRTASMYCTADSLVSVSAELNAVNVRACAHLAQQHSFTVARNTVDADRIRSLAASGDPAAPVTGSGDGRRYSFVTVGRLSAEKNHVLLLHAFADVHHTHPHTRLTVIGTGPLEHELRTSAKELKIADAVDFTGPLANPYAAMASADCFVLSSDYEGQPVVLLEALVLGLPIVTTDFASVAGVLPPGTGFIVGRSVADLANGMRAALDGAVPPAAFDDQAYNTTAMSEFYAAAGILLPAMSRDANDGPRQRRTR